MSDKTVEEIVMHGAIRLDSPQFGVMDPLSDETHPQEYYDAIKQRFAEEREIRMNYRPEGAAQYDTELQGELAKYDDDPHGGEITPREPLTDTVECLFIGGGFSALLTSARLREIGVESIRIVERGADVGGTWYWNRYPGIACDVPSYDYLPLLDEMNYVPKHRYARGEEIYAHCQSIAEKYDLYKLAVFQTTVTATVWNKEDQLWHITTNRGDHMKARFVICANGILSKPKLTKIKGVTEITEKGVIVDGQEYELDLLIFATGFEIQKTGIYNKIIGDNGVELNDKYTDGIRTLLGIHSKGYPNLFIMNGYQASFQFNLTDMMQSQGGHIAACIDYARKNDYQSLDVKQESEEFWVQEVIKFRGKTDRNKQCTPGYYNFEGADNRRQDGTYNGGFVQYMAEMDSVEKDLEKHFSFAKS